MVDDKGEKQTTEQQRKDPEHTKAERERLRKEYGYLDPDAHPGEQEGQA